MEVTMDLVRAAIGKTPALLTEILNGFKADFVKGAEAEGMVVRTKEQDQQFLTNHVNAVVADRVKVDLQKEVDKEFGNAMRKIDDEIKIITGIEKKPGEKTTDYAKRAVEEKRQGGDPVTREKVTQLEQLLASTKTDYETKLKDADAKLFNKEIEWQVTGALDKASIAVPVHLKTDDEKQNFINQQKGMMRQGFLGSYIAKKDEQGNVIYYEGDKPLMNQKDGKPKGASDIIGEKYSAWFVPPGEKKTGTGSGEGGGILPEGGFKKKEEIHEYLKANGIEAGTKDYMGQFEKLATDAKIEI
jgi:hypothetical protein